MKGKGKINFLMKIAPYLAPDADPLLITLRRRHGERGNSRHSYFCVQITVTVNTKRVRRTKNI